MKIFAVLLVSSLGAAAARAAEPSPLPAGKAIVELSVEPREAVLEDVRDVQSLVATGRTVDGEVFDLTRSAVYVSDQPSVAAVSPDGHVQPIAAGKAIISVRFGGKTATATITVADVSNVPPISYANEVQPVLSKGGCNAGACHGYSLGKNGFKLSLRGADPPADYWALTREQFGRRVSIDAPEASLILRKPAGKTPHEGGVRFDDAGYEYAVLRKWIEGGAQNDTASAPTLVEVKVFPEYRVIPLPGLRQQLQVLARYSNGAVRDVTHVSIYTSGADEVAEVDEDGLVRTKARGESPITIRYERNVLVSRLTVMAPMPEFTWTEPTHGNFIDPLVFAKLKDMKIRPAEIASDAGFLRRAYLDAIGLTPTPKEIREFLADGRHDKRARMIDLLLDRPEFVNHWSLKWADLLQNSREFLQEQEVWRMRQWLRTAVAINMPFDQFARELLTGQGAVAQTPAAAFYRVSRDPIISAERATQVFCGIRMLCARCHNHPFENWTQEDYYGLASFFTQVTAKKDIRDAKREIIHLNPEAAHATNPRSRKLQAPRFLGGKEPVIEAGADRREVFAKWLTAGENPFFARATVNRVWSYFFGRGIIEPVDDIRISNPAVNEPLLAALTKDFVANKFDMKRLMRTIMNSRTYQLAPESNQYNRDDGVNFSRHYPRRLSAEQFYDAVTAATGVQDAFPGMPAGFRAQELPDPQVVSAVLDLFGRPARKEACECERAADTSMIQALHMMNSDLMSRRIAGAGGTAAKLAASKAGERELVEEMFLLTVGRPPTEAEQEIGQKHMKAAKGRAEGVQDLMWALINSREFLFNN